jgi:hypothetical protein
MLSPNTTTPLVSWPFILPENTPNAPVGFNYKKIHFQVYKNRKNLFNAQIIFTVGRAA